MMNVERNLTMLTDFYELTMAGGYFENGMKDMIATFDMFYRRNPDKGGFAIMAGLEQVIEYLDRLSFTDEDIKFLRSKKIFSEEFLEYLADFQFTCDVWAVEEGTPIFPNEPIITVRGPIIQAQLVETMILLTVNHQSLIATKASRIVRAANGRSIMEFGSRRAHSYDGAIYGARAAYIGGCTGTACTIADRDFAIPALGTMAHSWIQSFDSEYEAFCAYAKRYPNSCTLLVDTYNVLQSGIPNAIKAFDNILKPLGYRPKGIRIDSGDITYLSKKARKMLDDAGYEDCKICASNSLDPSLSSAVFTRWFLSTKTAPRSRKSKSARTLQKLPIPASKIFTDCMTLIPTRQLPMSLHCSMRKSTTQSHTLFSTPNTRGSAKPLPISKLSKSAGKYLTRAI